MAGRKMQFEQRLTDVHIPDWAMNCLAPREIEQSWLIPSLNQSLARRGEGRLGVAESVDLGMGYCKHHRKRGRGRNGILYAPILGPA